MCPAGSGKQSPFSKISINFIHCVILLFNTFLSHPVFWTFEKQLFKKKGMPGWGKGEAGGEMLVRRRAKNA